MRKECSIFKAIPLCPDELDERWNNFDAFKEQIRGSRFRKTAVFFCDGLQYNCEQKVNC